MNVKQNVSNSEIINYPNYYNAGALDFGIHGPEMHNQEAHLSLYHFMEFNNINPRAYNTVALGGYFYALRPNDPKCKYVKFNYTHTKHAYSLFVNHISEFQKYLKN